MNSLAEALEPLFGGELVQPGDASYDSARRVWNAMIDGRPALIARCRTTADVVSAVNLAREAGIALAVRGGGHSVAGHSVCDGGLQIDLSTMHGVFVDPERRRASVQGGALLRDLDREAQRFGLVAPAGVVSHTGVGGLALGGGFGWLSRLYGLTCDNLVAAEVVTASGDVVVTDEQHDADLLWGLRGGGGNFGVVTRFEFDLRPFDGRAYSATFAFAADNGRTPLGTLVDLAENGPRELSLGLSVGAARALPFLAQEWHGRPVLLALIVYFGDDEEGRRLTAPLRSASPIAETAGPATYLEVQRAADESARPGLRRYWKGHFVRSMGDGAAAAFLEQGLATALASPNGGCELFALGGAVGDAVGGETSFAHREAQWDFIASAAWTDPSADAHVTGVARRAAEAIAPYATGVYSNDLGDEGTDRVRAAYGDDTYERLVLLKDRYDSANLFRRNQNIRPTAETRA